MPVYRQFHQAALDAQYNLRAAVPDHGDYFARWARDSAAIRRTQPCRLDLAYGAAPRQKLDFFPASASGAPVLVFLHGGYWQAMDKSDFSVVAPGFVDAGIAVAVVNYTLAPAGSIDAMMAETRAALDWLAGNAAALGINPERFAVCGHSAGGQLAMMAALAPSGRPARLACAISGVFDLEPVRLSYLNRVLGLDPAAAERNSPLHQVKALATSPSFAAILAVGGRETAEFRRQQDAFAAACAARGAAVDIVEQPDDHHFSIIDRLSDPRSPLHRRLVDAIARL